MIVLAGRDHKPASMKPTRLVCVGHSTDRGERLICSYNDPALDADATWLPIASRVDVDVVLADVRWPAGAARAAGVPAVVGVGLRRMQEIAGGMVGVTLGADASCGSTPDTSGERGRRA